MSRLLNPDVQFQYTMPWKFDKEKTGAKSIRYLLKFDKSNVNVWSATYLQSSGMMITRTRPAIET